MRAEEEVDEPEENHDNEVEDMFDSADEFGVNFGDFNGFASPMRSNDGYDQDFRGFPTSGGSSPFDLERGFKGWGSPEKKQDLEEPSGSSEGQDLGPIIKIVKVVPTRIVESSRVDMQHLKSVMLNIIRRANVDRESQLRDEGLHRPRRSVLFSDVLKELSTSDILNQETREDLSMPIGFLCLLTLANENDFQVKKVEGKDDFLIMYDPR